MHTDCLLKYGMARSRMASTLIMNATTWPPHSENVKVVRAFIDLASIRIIFEPSQGPKT